MVSLIVAGMLGGQRSEVIRDVEYVKVGDRSLKLDIYPAQGEGKAPLIVWIHGGGWTSGSKSNALPAVQFQRRNPEYSVASIEYRLSGEAIFPAQINDCKTAIAFLRRNADKYGFDSKKFVAWGSSAGGHLAALAGTSDEWDGLEKSLNKDSLVQAVIDYYGPTDLAAFATTPGFERHGDASSPESLLLGGKVSEKLDMAKKANPITFVSKSDPPFYVVHGSADRTVSPNQSELLIAALKKTGVPVESEVLEGAGHGGRQFTEAGLLDRLGAWLGKVLK